MGGLRSAMHDTFLMRRSQPLGHGTGNLNDALDRETARGDHAIEWLPLDQFHGEKVDAVAFLDRVQSHDIGVVEGGNSARLAMEPCEPVGILRHLSGQNLDCAAATQLGIRRAVHFSHTTGADGRLIFIDGEASTGSQGHRTSNDSTLTSDRRTRGWARIIGVTRKEFCLTLALTGLCPATTRTCSIHGPVESRTAIST